jgi:hypothetical protein
MNTSKGFFKREHIIGFTRVFYTHWVHTIICRPGDPENGIQGIYKEIFAYQQNLSMNLDEAEAKMQAKGLQYEVDDCLRGESSWFEKPLSAKYYAPELIAFSRFAGRKITSINDVEETYIKTSKSHSMVIGNNESEVKKVTGILWATYLNEDEKTIRGFRRRINARNQLIKLGLMVKVAPKVYSTPDKIKRDAIAASIVPGLHEEAGKRVALEVTLYKESCFQSDYGTFYIQQLLDVNNRLFIYKGTSPLGIKEGEKMAIKGTVKHDNYKGTAQTLLQRIKA